jgi:putative spermidine/putrescine transport system ATP-binding protein
MALLQLRDIVAGYGENKILKNFNLDIQKGELISLLGSSGCGKTTTLRLIAGFIDAEKGSLIFNGKDYTRMPLHNRNFGFVFQNYALFPHMTVYDNVAFGLKMRKIAPGEIKTRVRQFLEMVDMGEYEKRYPGELSGGQKQRVALARALAIKPDLLLLDEPLSNLDAKLRIKMRVEIRRLQLQFGITTVYVTHDQEECFAISDRVAIRHDGLIEQEDTPSKIFHCPRTEYIAKFVGFENFFRLVSDGGPGCFRTEQGDSFTLAGQGPQGNFRAAMRPDDMEIFPAGVQTANAIKGNVSICTFLGNRFQYNVKTGVGVCVVKTSGETMFTIGENVVLSCPGDKVILLPDGGGS